ncbi:putative tRNA, (5-methylaminomethyl-2-thiouridylate)-methyltransferase [Desulfamplus magnetovallimortis]|uniref:Putative tRNA, (5-methylaminomethyl-2-thiouridylate)-methyltransferase n=1 Tax=Desulfamplus magnetovallimortis TaxID=1246637 RepID=A0A1W1H634_9BACT|nr:tRNA 4-thiouridine(8) synthase ThiI [Desulfamplus magnetovallimortis]SLM27950.1 putative tRNA, (5-methylaminomethyl-2-thiouridylate)-methyltransferase [Desulfamplus magnetovallimortis]
MILSKNTKALGLCSGGLDSILSALILRKQGIDVTWITFKTPFFGPEAALKASKTTGIPLRIEEITDSYMEMLKSPPAGYGKNMNPCMDCHSLMFALAGDIMESDGYDFIFSGEVVGQRPMSQNKNSMNYVEKHSGYKGKILRPLSARILPETVMEQQGLVDRDALFGISGRSRKVQIEMAKGFGVTDYPAPAGGCLLTDKGFSRRLKDLMQHHQGDVYSRRDLYLLKYGRHIRLDDNTKIVVGKSRVDNNMIESMYKPGKDIYIRHASIAGPFVLVPGGALKDGEKMSMAIELAASICSGYTKASPGTVAQMSVMSGSVERIVNVAVPLPGQFRDLMI